MKPWKTAGLVLALCACVGAGGWGLRTALRDSASGSANSNSGGLDARAPVLRIPEPTSMPQPIALDAGVARRAVRDGVLRIALPDGAVYPVRIERQYTDGTGHWNVVGRGKVQNGTRTMVLTFGPDATFGMLPMPDGTLMHVTTTDGKVSMAPMGGLVPRDAMASVEAPATDFLMPAQPHGTTQPSEKAAMPPGDAVPRESVGTSSMKATAQSSVVGPVPSDTTPVTIDVLAVYAPDQVTLRGSVAAVETEFADLFAVANQAHIDSGSRVRLRMKAVLEADHEVAGTNQDVLGSATSQRPFEAARDEMGADLVAILRPHQPGDATCGIAYTPGLPQWRTRTMSGFGYSVSNTDGDCGGPLVFAHEVGHNLGAMHDRETDLSNGLVTLGAYWFSSGRIGDDFATIMAYPTYLQPWVPYFSNPGSAACGATCGVADEADNVRTFNLMAPSIAAFRGNPGELAIPDVEVVSPRYAETYTALEIRYTGLAGANIPVQVDQIDGDAVEGVDYELPDGNTLTIGAGSSESSMTVKLLPRAANTPDRMAVFRLSSQDGTPVEDSDATLAIVGGDRVVLDGKLWFPANVAPPSTPITVTAENFDGPSSAMEVVLSPPDYAYTLTAPHGAQLWMTPALPAPFAMVPGRLDGAKQSRTWYLFPQKGLRVSGTVNVAPGMVFPPSPMLLSMFEVTDGVYSTARAISIDGPGGTFSYYVPPGTDVTIEYDNPSPTPGNPERFAEYLVSDWDIAADAHHDIVLGTQPTLRAFPIVRSYQVLGGAVVHLSAPAPAGGVTYRCRTVDGSAKAGVDYAAMTATTTIPAGSKGSSFCGDLTVYRDYEHRPERFYIQIDQVSGAILTTPMAPIYVTDFYTGQVRTGGPGQKIAQ